MDAHSHAIDQGHGHGEEHPHEHPNYVKVWAILLALLGVSLLGPQFGIRWLTLITAFGVACVKAYLVAKNFMHLNVQKPFVIYLLVTVVVLLLLFFAAVAPDVMKHSGSNWENVAAEKVVNATPAPAAHE